MPKYIHMKCKILTVSIASNTPLETQINEFLAKPGVHVEDIKIATIGQSITQIYVFIFYTENEYLKGDKENV